MSVLHRAIERALLDISGIEIAPYKNTDLICVNYLGKEIAHFHGAYVLDLRLSAKFIRQEGLSRDITTQFHPKRSTNSRWICFKVDGEADLPRLVHLVEQAITMRQ